MFFKLLYEEWKIMNDYGKGWNIILQYDKEMVIESSYVKDDAENESVSTLYIVSLTPYLLQCLFYCQ